MADPDPIVDACAHHWMLGAPAREATAAVCKRCGAERDFLDTDRRAAWRAAAAGKPR